MTDINPTPRDADADLATCNAATPGPWVPYKFACSGWQLIYPDGEDSSIQSEEDAKFTAMAREALPYWIAEAKRLRAEVADLQSREVIEYDSTYFAPLGYADDTWEWYDASELHDKGYENLPHALYVLLSCPSPIEAFATYPTREAALQALRGAILAWAMQQNQREAKS